jgi:hypothetical protein
MISHASIEADQSTESLYWHTSFHHSSSVGALWKGNGAFSLQNMLILIVATTVFESINSQEYNRINTVLQWHMLTGCTGIISRGIKQCQSMQTPAILNFLVVNTSGEQRSLINSQKTLYVIYLNKIGWVWWNCMNEWGNFHLSLSVHLGCDHATPICSVFTLLSHCVSHKASPLSSNIDGIMSSSHSGERLAALFVPPHSTRATISNTTPLYKLSQCCVVDCY